MRLTGIHRPAIEDVIELSPIEMLHPGGMELTRRAAEIAGLQPGMHVLDVSSGRGTQSIFYAKEYGVQVTGVDISEDMLKSARIQAEKAGLEQQVKFEWGDSQELKFADDTFDAAINECAVGIPDDSQKVLDEMVRVTKPGGAIVIHESTWRKKLTQEEKTDIAERYGTTPFEYEEWQEMLKKAGVKDIITEFDQWSKPEMFWNTRADRVVTDHRKVLSLAEKSITALNVFKKFGFKGVLKAFQNEKIFYQIVLQGKLGYCLFKGVKA
ncbi:MAG: class I SAM-dependent methyltransferase [bacterium]